MVRRKVTALGGSVTVESEAGQWTRFTLRLPQSLSLMKVLLVRIDEDVYGLPAVDVDSVDRLDPKDVAEVAGIRAVRYRNRLLPLVALGPLLSLNGGPRHPRPTVAYVLHGDEGAAVVVDGLFGEREVAVKAPGAFLKGMRFVTGAAALEDGRVALLLSTPDLITAARRLASPAMSRGRDRRRLRILLVDDSAIAREAEAALLRSLGHEVDEAVDGEDGWQRLQGGSVPAPDHRRADAGARRHRPDPPGQGRRRASSSCPSSSSPRSRRRRSAGAAWTPGPTPTWSRASSTPRRWPARWSGSAGSRRDARTRRASACWWPTTPSSSARCCRG